MQLMSISPSSLVSEIVPLYFIAIFLFAILAGLHRAFVGEDRLLTLDLR